MLSMAKVQRSLSLGGFTGIWMHIYIHFITLVNTKKLFLHIIDSFKGLFLSIEISLSCICKIVDMNLECVYPKAAYVFRLCLIFHEVKLQKYI